MKLIKRIRKKNKRLRLISDSMVLLQGSDFKAKDWTDCERILLNKFKEFIKEI